METRIPKGYRSKLDLYETQSAISLIKRTFEDSLAEKLNLKRVSAPLFVLPETGLNDNLNGFERPVHFDVPACRKVAEVVHSLAKWKRMALHRYNFCGEGFVYRYERYPPRRGTRQLTLDLRRSVGLGESDSSGRSDHRDIEEDSPAHRRGDDDYTGRCPEKISATRPDALWRCAFRDGTRT